MIARRCHIASALTIALCGCGYRFTAGGAPLPEGIQKVYAPMFINHTGSNPINRLGETYRAANEPGVETIFTQAFREVLQRAGVAGEANAPARIEGEIVGMDGSPSVLSTSGTLASYRVHARVRLRLIKNGRQIGSTAEVYGFEDYLPGRQVAMVGETAVLVDGDVLLSETNRAAAIQRLAETLMREGYDRLATGW
jgi:hypothetical protein